MKKMITLGIETSCDETAVAVVKDGKILSSEVSSSIHLHSQYGGVIPEIASRYHVEYIYPALKKALSDANVGMADIDLVSVTKGPGLPGSLLVGIAFAKALSYALDIPIIGADHLKAHIFSCFINGKHECEIDGKFPFLGMVISGGHTSIFYCRDMDNFDLIGRTKDDAVGEAFDKVAKIMDLGYPGGPIIEKRAGEYMGEDLIDFPRALLQDSNDIDFSFSGIKTAVLYHWRDSAKDESEKTKVCRSFQDAVIDVVIKKIKRALEIKNTKRLAVGGGVINNEALRRRIMEEAQTLEVELFLPEKEFCTDNAAMIAAIGEKMFKSGKRSDLSLNAEPVFL